MNNYIQTQVKSSFSKSIHMQVHYYKARRFYCKITHKNALFDFIFSLILPHNIITGCIRLVELDFYN